MPSQLSFNLTSLPGRNSCLQNPDADHRGPSVGISLQSLTDFANGCRGGSHQNPERQSWSHPWEWHYMENGQAFHLPSPRSYEGSKSHILQQIVYSQCVSIGPYHYGKPHLAAMEDHKTRALQQFLHRTGKKVEDFYSALIPMTENLMDSYLQLGIEWKGDKERFLYLMLYDGSFLYELMTGVSKNNWDGYHKEDLIFSHHGFAKICPYVLPDILMLENQLPLPVLQCLIAIVMNRLPSDQQNYIDARDLVFTFLAIENSPEIPEWEGLHILDISRKGLARGFLPISDTRREASVFLKSATELQDAGIKLSANASEDDINISFNQINGTLSLPLLALESHTKAHFLNAIAFESLHPTARGEVGSYVAFMKGLIPSAGDAAALASVSDNKIIQSDIGDASVVAEHIKDISKNVMFDPSSNLCVVRDIVGNYYKSQMRKWPRRLREWWRVFRDDHLKNPCTVITLFFGFAILLLTLLQTIFTIKG